MYTDNRLIQIVDNLEKKGPMLSTGTLFIKKKRKAIEICLRGRI